MTRRRSENFELYRKAGSTVKALNRERKRLDERNRPKDEMSEFPFWIFNRRKNKPQNPKSEEFERKGRVT